MKAIVILKDHAGNTDSAYVVDVPNEYWDVFDESLAALDTVPLARKPAAVNVVGVIRGGDPTLKNEYILVDAHYDHLGMRGPGVNGDSVFNGADDDASGVTAVLEIARQIHAGATPKRTIVFAATMGEEVGLLGTNWYIAHPPIPLSQMAANLEIEMIGRPDSLAGGVGRELGAQAIEEEHLDRVLVLQIGRASCRERV